MKNWLSTESKSIILYNKKEVQKCGKPLYLYYS